ncbi:MAG: hypothetical protein Q9166_001833 [cf. Caloplaca sp. 2 TL-2023]
MESSGLHGGVSGQPALLKQGVSATTPRSETTADSDSGMENEVLDNLQLPLSPLMDPKHQAARNRHKTSKREPSGDLSAFQKKLRKNPYARALAKPIRQCAVTGARLPNFFLLDFGLVPHPKTGRPWQISKLAVEDNVDIASDRSMPEETEQNTAAPNQNTAALRSARPVAGSYVIAQQSAMKLMSSLKHRSYMQMLPHRWKLDARFKADQIVWRKDMDTFVLDLMRRKVVKLLKYLSFRPAAYVVPCQEYADIQNKHQAGAVLWLGEPNDETTVPSVESPPPYAMVEYRSSGHLPLYNLSALLGSEYLLQLRDASELFGGTLAVIKRKQTTSDCQLQLWKLMGYLASETSAG